MIRAALIGHLVVSVTGCSSRSEVHLQELYDSATAQLWRGELTDASNCAAEGEMRSASQPDSPWPWKFKLLTAEINLVRRDLTAAARLLEDHRQRARRSTRSQPSYLQGQLAVLQGNLAGAGTILADAAQRARRASTPDIELDVRNMQGQVLILQRRWDDAEDAIGKTISQAQRQRDPYREAVALQNLGTGHLFRDRFDDGLQYFERVLANKSLASQLVYSVALTDAGVCYYRLGDIARASEPSAVRLPRMNIRDGPACTTSGCLESWATPTS